MSFMRGNEVRLEDGTVMTIIDLKPGLAICEWHTEADRHADIRRVDNADSSC
jgi:uncharacterized protein YodC (DUF2158 family)